MVDRRQEGTETPEKQPEDGVVLHQPLNRAISLIFGQKRQKMNGVSVCLARKTQNAPTWQVEKQAGRSVVFGSWLQKFLSSPHKP